jgi:hypothetical protein
MRTTTDTTWSGEVGTRSEDLPIGGTVVCALGLTMLMLSSGLALGGGKESGPSVPFAVARVYFEQNATDGDVEVVLEVKGGDEGLAKLAVVSPDGRPVIDFTAPDASTLGIRQFHFESPEPQDVKSLKSAYPEGVYTFAGATASGKKLHGKATLSHTLPAAASFLRPGTGARGVDAKDLKIIWAPVKNLAAYIITIKQRPLGANLTARLPGSVATFAVPDGFLLAGTEYELAIGTVTKEGNISFIETTFTTAGKE